MNHRCEWCHQYNIYSCIQMIENDWDKNIFVVIELCKETTWFLYTCEFITTRWHEYLYIEQLWDKFWIPYFDIWEYQLSLSDFLLYKCSSFWKLWTESIPGKKINKKNKITILTSWFFYKSLRIQSKNLFLILHVYFLKNVSFLSRVISIIAFVQRSSQVDWFWKKSKGRIIYIKNK